MISRAATAGANRIAFSGRLKDRLLPPGPYRGRMVAADSAGARPAARTVRFTVTTPGS